MAELETKTEALAGFVPTILKAKDVTLSLCGDDGIEFKGQRFVPDPTKGYFSFSFSHAFPNSTVRGEGIHPNVIARSFQSLLNQNVNIEHQIAEYHKGEKDVRDRVIGSVVAVDFPGGQDARWQINPDPAKAPGITGVGVIYKQTQGTARIFGEHQVGRKKFTVSMEVLWPRDEAGYAVELNGGAPLYAFSPSDFIAAGWEYVPEEKAPAELQAAWSEKRGMIVSRYQSRKVVLMMGGLAGQVHYAGVGVVSFGAERAAKITRLVASGEHPLGKLADEIKGDWETLASKS
jgi:hypothetical protein